MQPTLQHHARVDVADVLRGLAVMGIILLHSIEHFNFYSFPDTAGQGALLDFTDRAIWDGLFFLLGGKAYAIFALLFGFSFFIQDDNQRMRGNDFRRRFCWRLLLLFIIGNFNACFFTGEILVMYSLIGIVLVLTCRLSTKWVLAIAAVCMLQPVAIYNVIRASLDSSYITPTVPSSHLWGAAFAMQSGGTFLGTVAVNIWEGQLASLAWAWDHGRIFQTASLFMLGMVIGRNGLFLKEHLPMWGRVLAISLIAFFPLHGLDQMLPDFIDNKNILSPLLIIISSLANLSFMLVLVSGILFAFYRTNMHDLLMKITPYGKMSMTNYVTQSIIGSMIYYNWGFGMHAHLGITASFLLGIVLFVLQYMFCRWWISSHSHGPMEYMWKRATWIDKSLRPTVKTL
ncbi:MULTISPECIES: DUF418 domain-containing protein [Muribaculum]|jgi:uncharacterized protein|uniref:DUF418 domain-containing protein n=8 Tax=Muribaculum TaxID=1918540 RepID=A0A4P7VEP7_9BACT|nr:MULTISPECIES: DUF418 domain-containing protein [Muribaculum]MCX4278989.1 DUF418 domain-containing protein [Muribaculum sp.]QCD35230.1 DUF418 domain-containing protein [Muribaculum gordoncarteri]